MSNEELQKQIEFQTQALDLLLQWLRQSTDAFKEQSQHVDQLFQAMNNLGDSLSRLADDHRRHREHTGQLTEHLINLSKLVRQLRDSGDAWKYRGDSQPGGDIDLADDEKKLDAENWWHGDEHLDDGAGDQD